MLERRGAALLLLGGALAAIYGMVAWLVASQTLHARPALGVGATLDLTVTAALATWWLGSRRGHLPRRAPAVAVAVGLLAARLLLPPEARDAASVLRWVWGGVELAVVALVVARIGQIRARYRALRLSGIPDALAQALAPTIGALPARALATELDALGHALLAWRRPTPAEDARTFSMHRRSHYPVVVGVLLFALAGETIGQHFLVARFSVAAAWVLTALSLWGALWLVGDAHAVRLRPLRLTAEGLLVEVGIRWHALVPYDAIASARPAQSPPRHPALLRATVAGAADVHLTLSRELTAHGLLGRRKRFTELLLSVDRPDELLAALSGSQRRR